MPIDLYQVRSQYCSIWLPIHEFAKPVKAIFVIARAEEELSDHQNCLSAAGHLDPANPLQASPRPFDKGTCSAYLTWASSSFAPRLPLQLGLDTIWASEQRRGSLKVNYKLPHN